MPTMAHSSLSCLRIFFSIPFLLAVSSFSSSLYRVSYLAAASATISNFCSLYFNNCLSTRPLTLSKCAYIFSMYGRRKGRRFCIWFPTMLNANWLSVCGLSFDTISSSNSALFYYVTPFLRSFELWAAGAFGMVIV